MKNAKLKLIALLYFILFCIVAVNAQTKPKETREIGDDGWEVDKPSKRKNLHLQDYVTLNVGTAIQMGSLRNVAGSKNGLDFSAIYSAPCYNTHFGLSFAISQNKNKLKSEDLFYSELANNTVLNYEKGEDLRSTSKYFMIGLYYTKPVGKFAFDSRLLVGANISAMPETSAEIVYNDGIKHIIGYDGDNSFSVAFQAGVTVKYSLSKRICAVVNLDYKACKAHYRSYVLNEILQPDGTYNGETTYSKVNVNLTSMNVSFGLGYIFGKK